MSAQFDRLPSALAAPVPASFRADPFTLALVNVIKEGLLRDQHVRLHQFGTFRLKWSKPSIRKHPTTGEPLHLPPQPRVYFTPAKYLRELIEPHPQPASPLPMAHVTPLPATAAAIFSPRTTVETASAQPEEATRPVVNTETAPQQKPRATSGMDKRLVMGAGLLASVPLILALLNAQFASAPPVTSAVTVMETTGITSSAVVSSSPDTVESVRSGMIDHSADTKTASHQADAKNRTEIPLASDRKPTVTGSPVTVSRKEKVTPVEVKAFLNPQIHTITEGDNLWRLARRYFNNPLLWPYIYRANRNSLRDPNYLVAGQSVVIPGLRHAASQLHSTDSKHVAEGYLLLYHYYQAKGDTHAYRYLIGARRFDNDLLDEHKTSIHTADLQKVLASGKPFRLN